MENNPINFIYGCSTTGIEWRFLKYENQEIIVDEERFLVNELPRLLGVLQAIIEASAKPVKV